MASNTDSTQEKKGVYYTLPNNKYVKEYREILIDKSGVDAKKAEEKAKAYLGHMNIQFIWMLCYNCRYLRKLGFVKLISGRKEYTTQYVPGLHLSSIANCSYMDSIDTTPSEACISKIISTKTLKHITDTLKIDKGYITGERHLLEEGSDAEITLFMLVRELAQQSIDKANRKIDREREKELEKEAKKNGKPIPVKKQKRKPYEKLDCIWVYKLIDGPDEVDDYEAAFDDKSHLSKYIDSREIKSNKKEKLDKDKDLKELFQNLSMSNYANIYRAYDIVEVPETPMEKVLYYLRYEQDISNKGDELFNAINDAYLDPIAFSEYLAKEKKLEEEKGTPEKFLKFMKILDRYWSEKLAIVKYWEIMSVDSITRKQEVQSEIDKISGQNVSSMIDGRYIDELKEEVKQAKDEAAYYKREFEERMGIESDSEYKIEAMQEDDE